MIKKLRFTKSLKPCFSQTLGNEKKAKILFSPKRIESFGGATKHFSHLQFTQEIFPLIQNIEIILRNKIDEVMRGHSKTWLIDLYLLDFEFFGLDYQKLEESKQEAYDKTQKLIGKELDKIFKQEKIPFEKHKKDKAKILSIKDIHERLLSKMALGFWISIFLNNDFKSFDLHSIIFPKLFARIKNSQLLLSDFLDKDCYRYLQVHKTDHRFFVLIFVSFITSIRNRAFHWENLLKVNIQKSKNGKIRIFSSLSSVIEYNQEKFYTSLQAKRENIRKYLKVLLEDLLEIQPPKGGGFRSRNLNQQNFSTKKTK